MAKFVPRSEAVEAVQVNFGKGGWPEWLEGKVWLRNDPEQSGGVEIADGDYLVSQTEDHIAVMSPDRFEEQYRPARERRGKED